LTIKSTSHTILSTLPPDSPPFEEQIRLPDRRQTLLSLRLHSKLVFCMPVNIQLSKISIASAISKTARFYKLPKKHNQPRMVTDEHG
jgi:hypothetical protein